MNVVDFSTRPLPAPDSITEDWIALRFADQHKDALRYCHDTGAWFVWSGYHWQRNRTKLAFSYCRDLCRSINGEENKTLSALKTATAVEKFAQSDQSLAATTETWDRDLWLIGTPGGTVDLRNGKLREPRQEDHITKLAGASPVRGAHPAWSRFLAEATKGDEGLQRFLKQMAGYCLTGSTREHALFFVYGLGGNGKSVFLNVLNAVMGDYACTAAMDTFTASQYDKHPTDLADLRGSRMVAATETEEGRAWAEARIKQMTGGDRIKARFMRQDFFHYDPQFKLVIVGNHMPVLRNVDEAVQRRFNIIPFIHKPEQPDPDLELKLRAELPMIVQWAIDGCLDWQKNGLVRPEVVTEATKEYFSEQDIVRQWAEEYCELGKEKEDTTEELFRSWSAYAKASGEDPGTQKRLAKLLPPLGCVSIKNVTGHHGKRGFRGISVNPKKVRAHHSD